MSNTWWLGRVSLASLAVVAWAGQGNKPFPPGCPTQRAQPNEGIQATVSSVRCAPASGNS
jgi:hypothetical protein